MEIIVRRCSAGDLPAIASLMAELAEVAGSHSDLEVETVRKMWRRMEEFPEHYLTLVAESAGEVVGAATLLFYHSFLHRVGTAQINELVVTGAWRGRGIGAKLVQACRDEALRRNMDELEVGTETDNLAARNFYRQMGFDEEFVLLGMEFAPTARGHQR